MAPQALRLNHIGASPRSDARDLKPQSSPYSGQLPSTSLHPSCTRISRYFAAFNVEPEDDQIVLTRIDAKKHRTGGFWYHPHFPPWVRRARPFKEKSTARSPALTSGLIHHLSD